MAAIAFFRLKTRQVPIMSVADPLAKSNSGTKAPDDGSMVEVVIPMFCRQEHIYNKLDHFFLQEGLKADLLEQNPFLPLLLIFAGWW